jgi:hypothetical protein
VHRRDVLRLAMAGVATAGFAPFLGCSSDSEDASLASPTRVPFDPDTPWWLQGGFAPVEAEVDTTDEGWLLSYLHDEASARSRFVVLDATDVAAGPVASVALPQRVPHGFHATWVSER